jgi:hypothetical protein
MIVYAILDVEMSHNCSFHCCDLNIRQMGKIMSILSICI